MSAARRQRLIGAGAGLAAAAAALGTSELLAGLDRRTPSLVVSIGNAVIDLAPGWSVRAAIETFGTSDKVALVVGIVLLTVAVGAGLGAFAARGSALARRWVPLAVFTGFAAAGVLAAGRSADASVVGTVLVAAASVAVGLVTLTFLLGRGSSDEAEPQRAEPMDRRRFVGRIALVSAGAVVAAAAGRRLNGRFSVAPLRADVILPSAQSAAAGGHLPAFGIEGLSPRLTPNEDFYRIDTALVVPRVDPGRWQLSVDGFVDRPFALTFDELVARATTEVEVSLACVSNEVGGPLVGNASWLGVPLGDLLEEAGVQPAGVQVMGRSVDGFTAGFPTELAFDGRPALVAVGMNGEPLPLSHGFPARLVVSGVYGYVSATKWLSEIWLTSFDVDGFWIPRGWAKEAPIKVQSRIDVPSAGARLGAGPLPVAGVAWAQPAGVARVEVRVDDGPWADAMLDDLATGHTWRQWWWPWTEPTSGRHTLTVRATDADGHTQTASGRPPAPDGATGHHQVTVTVAA